MGRDKALVTLQDRPLVAHVAAALKTVTPHVIVVGRDSPIAGLATVPDTTTGRRGPVAGLETGLIHAQGAGVLLVGTDQPFVRVNTLRALLEFSGGDAVVPVHGGIQQTTCALYRDTCLPAARAVLEAGGGSLRQVVSQVATTFVEEATWRRWGEDGLSWFSIDTEADLAEAEVLLTTGDGLP
jgi:molybdopterin-guanine dinucleotide biosynthesis protein A